MFKLPKPRHTKKRYLTVIKFVLLALITIVAIFLAALHFIRVHNLPDGSTPGEIVTFLHSYGWDVSDEPVEVKTVQIPQKFSAPYREYNEIQKKQGFNLKRYRSEYADNYVFKVNNHPATTNDGSDVYANVLVSNGKIIGGDICSYALNGFMTGFNSNSKQ
jgi:hypothetical protein